MKIIFMYEICEFLYEFHIFFLFPRQIFNFFDIFTHILKK